MYYLCSAIIPYYDPYGGNATYTLLTDGTKETFDLSIKNYIYHMFRQLYMDPLALKNWVSHILSAKSNMPLILTDAYIFIPIKVRYPIGRLDGAFGYVALDAMVSYKDGVITLKNGVILETLSSDSYITKKIKDAKLLAYAYKEQRKPFEFILQI